MVRRDNFGGVSLGIHLLSFWGVDTAVFHPPPALPRILAHVVNAATPDDPSREIEFPCPIDVTILRAPIVRDGMLQLEGLFDVFEPSVPVACPCVFKASGWAQRSLSTKELLRVFDTPLDMDNLLIEIGGRGLLYAARHHSHRGLIHLSCSVLVECDGG